MEDKNFGDFEEVQEDGPKKETVAQPQMYVRAREPRGKEKIGIIAQRLGGNRMNIQTTDGKVMNCRVPGRFKKRMWLRPKDIVMIEPWELDPTKGDVIYKYNPSEVTQLRKKGLLNSLNSEF